MTIMKYVLQPFMRIFKFLTMHMMQAARDDANLGLANSRIPPSWSVERDKIYPLRYYRTDLEVWSASTDMDALRQGPAASMRITGAARLIIREMPINLLINGQVVQDDQGNNVQLSGLGMLLRTLERRYGATEQETQIHSISELMGFSRQNGESTDELLARFDVLVHRADNHGGMVLGTQVKAWMILTHLRIPRTAWMVILAPTNGLLPADMAEYIEFVQYIRRNGHLHDTGNGDRQKTIAQPYYVEESTATHTYFGQTQVDAPYQTMESWNAYPSVTGDDDNISWHSYSTGQSDDGEPIDWNDFEQVPPHALGEEVYLAYRGAKRRWRSFGGKGRPRFKGKGRKGGGKGSGTGFGKGKGKYASSARAFWTDDFGNNIPIPQTAVPTYSDESPASFQIYFKGKGKGAGGNPIGKDGVQMLCSICGSGEHFRAKCTSSKGKGKGGHSKGSFWAEEQTQQSQWIGPDDTAWSVPSSSVSASSLSQPRKVYFSTPNAIKNEREAKSCIYFTDGTAPIPLTPIVRELDDDQFSASYAVAVISKAQHLYEYYHPPAYTWFNDANYHARVKLLVGEALLVDTGAVGNLSGDLQFYRMAALAKTNGQGATYTPLKHTLSIDGVGSGKPSTCTQTGIVHIALAGGQLASYTAPIIPQSQVPSLLGLTTMTELRVVLDLVHDKWIALGPGGMEMKLSPGSKVLDLKRSPTGHLMLPCSEWERVDAKSQIALTAVARKGEKDSPVSQL